MPKITRASFPDHITVKKTEYTLGNIWAYKYPDGTTCYWRVRYENIDSNTYQMRLFFNDGKKIIKKKPAEVNLIPFRSDEIQNKESAAILIVPNEWIALCESAKNLEKESNFIVTTIPDQIGKCNIDILFEREVYYLPDFDKQGHISDAVEMARYIDDLLIVPRFIEWKYGESLHTKPIDGKELAEYIYNLSEPAEVYELGSTEKKNTKKKNEKNKTSGTLKNYPFVFLGYDDKAYYFLPKNQNIPIRIARGNNSIKNHIEEIGDRSWWFVNFNHETSDGREVFDLPAAAEWLRHESYNRGVYDDGSILGVGPHRDEGKIVINTGRNLLIYGNGAISYNDYHGDLVFCRSKFKFEIPDAGWTQEERQRFSKQLNTFKFEKPLDRAVVAGFIAVAPFASLLYRCPHIWLTGQKGSGKTYLIDMVIEQALGKFVVKAEGGTSEAGIRQSIGRDCRPVIVDEFEANNPGELLHIKSVLSLARSAYGGSKKIKGSASGEAVDFNTKMMFCFSSIKTYLDNAADASRIVVCRLKRRDRNDPELHGLPDMNGLRRMMYERLEELIENCSLAKKEIVAAGYEQRTGDTYAPFLAGAWMIASDKPFMSGAKKINDAMAALIAQIGTEEKEEDEERILDHILQHVVRLDGSTTRTVAEMLIEKEDMSIVTLRYDSQLRQLGIRRFVKNIDDHEQEVLAISCRHSEIKRIMEKTAFVEYKDVLSRHKAFIPVGDEKYPTVRMAGKNERSLLLNWDIVELEYFGEPDKKKKEDDEEVPF